MTTEKHNNPEENLQGSWVELHFNNGGGGSPSAPAPGAASGEEQEQLPGSGSGPAAEQQLPGPAAASMDMEKMLLEAQHESGRSSSRGSLPCDSPPRSQTPLHLRRGSDVNSSGGKNSSQSEEDFLERRREVENLMKKNADWIWDWSSRPENIPPKEFLLKHPKRSSAAALSIRNTSMMKKGGIFSAEFLKVFLPSLLVSHILAVGLGVYIGRRLTTSTSTF
ncbi:BCL2/adenovirus E1B 19 kDa protein-interacting protein 3 isoform X1 [Engraulis encrasicolus]|uniref:BCL2/adenovirus E1B 19 kDa protein-interacting protein 3 isoform X1 n=1 Tax=Engraulis encrasicolus TaxID=184585 RepID=UPI002FD3B1A1